MLRCITMKLKGCSPDRRSFRWCVVQCQCIQLWRIRRSKETLLGCIMRVDIRVFLRFWILKATNRTLPDFEDISSCVDHVPFCLIVICEWVLCEWSKMRKIIRCFYSCCGIFFSIYASVKKKLKTGANSNPLVIIALKWIIY